MSEAMSSREIEDVLTSIRRLVAQDGARPITPVTAAAAAQAGRLILTESQRVDAARAQAAQEDAVQEPVTNEPEAPRVPMSAAILPAPDFGRLEATIAELEAAVSASGGAWEGEVPDESPRASNVTELYGRVAHATRRDAEAAAPGATQDIPVVEVPANESPGDDAEISLADTAEWTAPPSQTAPETSAAAVFDVPNPMSEIGSEPAYGDEAILDEAGLHALVAQIVREELQGQLGERITAQVRRLVRAEIAKALDDRHIL